MRTTATTHIDREAVPKSILKTTTGGAAARGKAARLIQNKEQREPVAMIAVGEKRKIAPGLANGMERREFGKRLKTKKEPV
jgi:hypothetical protein